MTVDHYLRLVWDGLFLTMLPSAQSAAAGGEEKEARASSAVVFRVGWISHSASSTPAGSPGRSGFSSYQNPTGNLLCRMAGLPFSHSS